MSSSLTNCMLNFVPTPMTVRRRPPTLTCCPIASSPPKSCSFSLNPRTQTGFFDSTSLSPRKRPATVLRPLIAEGGRDAVDVDASGDAAGGDDGARFADRADRGNQAAPFEILLILDAQAVREMRFG